MIDYILVRQQLSHPLTLSTVSIPPYSPDFIFFLFLPPKVKLGQKSAIKYPIREKILAINKYTQNSNPLKNHSVYKDELTYELTK